MAKKKRAKSSKRQPCVITFSEPVAVGVSDRAVATCSNIRTEAVSFDVDNSNSYDGRQAGWSKIFPFRKGYNGEAPYDVTLNVRRVLPNWDGKNWCALRHLLELGGVDYRRIPGWSLWDLAMRLQLAPPYRQTCNMIELCDLAADRRKRMKASKNKKRVHEG